MVLTTEAPANVKHFSITNEHFTPPCYIEASRATMGEIYLDPASCYEANQIVKALDIFTEADNGLEKEWHGNIFLNPPGAKSGNESNLALWWDKLLDEYESGRVKQAIFLSFQMSILRIRQSVFSFPFCVPKDRIHFWNHEDNEALYVKYRKLARKKLGVREPERLVDELARELLQAFISKRLSNSDKHIRLESGKHLIESPAPSHDNVIICLPPVDSFDAGSRRFRKHFNQFGRVVLA